jgi:hydroxymethylglutaryl-CoA lyase
MACDFTVYEVGPRDGLQSLSHVIPVENRVELIHMLAAAGLKNIEAGSFVNPERVPTMADTDEVLLRCVKVDAQLSALVPNARGMRDARAVGVERFNVFFSADEEFNLLNLGKTREQAVEDFAVMLFGVPKEHVRVYVSLAFSSPLDEVADAVADAETLGGTVVLCDTEGRASPDSVRQVVGLSGGRTALHLHHGREGWRMFENIAVAYDSGIREFDASIGGLGGCPFVLGSRGNLDTSELVAWGIREGLDCGIELEALEPARLLAMGLRKEVLA